MATRYFCDGCDQEVGDDRSFVVSIATPREIMADLHASHPTHLKGENYHLCGRCESALKMQANPKTWLRPDRAA